MGNVTAYVDGWNLYFGMKRKYGRRFQWLDVVELVRRIRPTDQVVAVRYFSAIVKNEPAAAANQTTYLDALRVHNGAVLDIHLARFKDRVLKPCRRCGKNYTCDCGWEYRSYEEKETDVALGAYLVEDAAIRVGDISLLITADSDLAPAVKAARRVDPTRQIVIAMPPGNLQPSRRFGPVGSLFINEAALRNSQLPATVTDAVTGRTYARPTKWV